MTTVEKNSIPRSALILGYAGLIPFVVISAALWFMSGIYAEELKNALLLYAAIILSFMGAIHWGVAMAKSDNPDARQLTLIGGLAQWSILYIAFAGLCVLDSVSTKQGNMTAWYPALRVPLTVVVVLSLVNAQLAEVMA